MKCAFCNKKAVLVDKYTVGKNSKQSYYCLQHANEGIEFGFLDKRDLKKL